MTLDEWTNSNVQNCVSVNSDDRCTVAPAKLPEKVSDYLQETYRMLIDLNSQFVDILRMVNPQADASAGPTKEPECMLENAFMVKMAAEEALKNIGVLRTLL